MFLAHFHLREQPFGVTPDPAYLYLSRTHQSALDALSAGIRNDRGFMTVIAEPGMGKTTLLYRLLDQLRDSARTLFVFQTQCDSHEFFGHLLTEFGMNPAGMDIVAMHERLNKALFCEMLAGKRVVLIVDEAQNLAEPVLETVRLLSNFETPHAKLLQIIFAGQPQLASNLASPALAQLRQRITVVAHLSPFRVDETAAYIQHRLKVGGYRGEGIFTDGAIAAIAEQSTGIPRIINNLCFNAMSLGFERGLTLLDADIVGEAVGQLCLAPVPRLVLVPREASVPQEVSVPAPPVALRLSAAAESNMGRAMRQVSRLFMRVPRDTVRGSNGSRIYGSAASWVYGSAALALFILLGVWGISRSFGKQVKAAQEIIEGGALQQTVEPTLDSVSGAPQAMTSLQFLLVSAQPNDTAREICLRYLGKFDDEILNQIKALNPELKNLNQIKSGQLLRVPFPSGTLKKVFDSDSAHAVLAAGTAARVVKVDQPSSKQEIVSASANTAPVQSLGAIKREPLRAAASAAPSTTPNQPAAGKPEVSNAEVPSAAPALKAVETNIVSPRPLTVAAVNPPAEKGPPEAAIPAANPVETAKLEPAELISGRDPVYPSIAKSSRISGSVEIHFRISAEGTVSGATVVKGSPLLAQAALQALQSRRYKPAHLNGSPVESEATMVFDFKGN